MDNKTLTGADYLKLLQKGYEYLSRDFEAINDLNVFPVPDGDTGTNMKLTFAGGLRAINKDDDLGSIATDFARGSLFAARGNSGVLSSQYYKGISDGLKNKSKASVLEFAKALVSGYKVAYAAAADPVEGTILTVAREGIENAMAKKANLKDFETLLTAIVEEMKKSLDNTPNLLPLLKEAGVVDSGGKGLLTIFQGFLSAYKGEETQNEESNSSFEEHISVSNAAPLDYSAFDEHSSLDYGYCTEFMLQLLEAKIDVAKFSVKRFINWLESHGNSIVCFQTGTIVKVHIHTKTPWEVIRYAQKYGEFVTFKMENMALQHNEVIRKEEKKEKAKVKSAIIAIAQGDGIKELFRNMGADYVIDGGSTMNASTEEIIAAAKEVNASDVILLPNEGNILLAAKQAAKLYKKCKIHVVETKTMIEGYSALSMLMDKDDVVSTISSFEEAKNAIKSGFVALSNRDVTIDKENIPSGTYIGAYVKDIIASGKSAEEAFVNLVNKMEGIEDKSMILIIKGKPADKEASEKLFARLQESYPNKEIGLIDGNQEVYDYLLGAY